MVQHCTLCLFGTALATVVPRPIYTPFLIVFLIIFPATFPVALPRILFLYLSGKLSLEESYLGDMCTYLRKTSGRFVRKATSRVGNALVGGSGDPFVTFLVLFV